MSCNNRRAVFQLIANTINYYINISVVCDFVVVAIPYDRAIAVIPIGIPTARFAYCFTIDRQTAAPIERIIADACHATRDLDTRQTAAIRERIRADTFQLTVCTKGHCRQSAATIERIIADACHTVGDH